MKQLVLRPLRRFAFVLEFLARLLHAAVWRRSVSRSGIRRIPVSEMGDGPLAVASSVSETLPLCCQGGSKLPSTACAVPLRVAVAGMTLGLAFAPGWANASAGRPVRNRHSQMRTMQTGTAIVRRLQSSNSRAMEKVKSTPAQQPPPLPADDRCYR